MKKYLSIILGIILAVSFVGCGHSDMASVNDNKLEDISSQEAADTEEQKQSSEEQQTDTSTASGQENEEKTAVVYFSGTGNTKEIADLLAKEADADIYEIIPENMYTSDSNIFRPPFLGGL